MRTHAIIRENHRHRIGGSTNREAAELTEELEEKAQLYFLLGDRGDGIKTEQIAVIRGGKAK